MPTEGTVRTFKLSIPQSSSGERRFFYSLLHMHKGVAVSVTIDEIQGSTLFAGTSLRGTFCTNISQDPSVLSVEEGEDPELPNALIVMAKCKPAEGRQTMLTIFTYMDGVPYPCMQNQGGSLELWNHRNYTLHFDHPFNSEDIFIFLLMESPGITEESSTTFTSRNILPDATVHAVVKSKLHGAVFTGRGKVCLAIPINPSQQGTRNHSDLTGS
eukprot:gb/GECG01008221.1/.p1 GENE.gb/GECG01008221.1/~~gb/GECG01008221.1/.p1  ORF type:complete len:214 (+),score=13.85 gb/GECG01008221.1/:1-642(+)